jgi:hypothetical protein
MSLEVVRRAISLNRVAPGRSPASGALGIIEQLSILVHLPCEIGSDQVLKDRQGVGANGTQSMRESQIA